MKTLKITSIGIWRTAATTAVVYELLAVGALFFQELIPCPWNGGFIFVLLLLSPVAGLLQGFVLAVAFNAAAYVTGGLTIEVEEAEETGRASHPAPAPTTNEPSGK